MRTEKRGDLGTAGEKRQSWLPTSPRQALERLMSRNPEWTLEELAPAMWEINSSSEMLMREVNDEWLETAYRAALKKRMANAKPAAERPAEPTPADLALGVINKGIDRIANERVRLLLWRLPNGKMLRDATREELMQLGGWMQRLAARLQPNQTVAEAGISEAELSELYAPQ